ncbi:hypothetical protein B0A55_01377 [Friedmanniomyces simplex]|uniref:Bromodomain associated domain-containing protein n=1 Tax=Friedmanniomyces simplex TaxID=329884 RepID=A0A4U0Y1N0_9PEZI|nr:hypothetical protein B0A55_01377 [Friedmanniomyces simplex]
MSQTTDLHRALLRPAIIHLLRAAGFHSTKPSVLDTLTNIAERYLLLLASTTARYAHLSHNDPIPTVTDVRLALTDCGALVPAESATEEAWRELMRVPIEALGRTVERGGEARMRAEKRKRDEEDVADVSGFQRWFDGREHAEARRVAGMGLEDGVTGLLPAVGVGGGVVQAEDFLAGLRKKLGKAGEESRLLGTVLGREAEGRRVLVEGGPVQSVGQWRPRMEEVSAEVPVVVEERNVEVAKEASDSGTETGDSPAPASALEEAAAT